MVRLNDNGHPIPPEEVDAEEGMYAVAIHQGGQTIFRYETPSPLRSEPTWSERDHFDHDEVPRMNLQNAVIDYEPSNGGLEVVWVLTETLYADNPPDTQNQAEESPQHNRSANKYLVSCTCGEEFGHSQQQKVMGRAVDHLLEEHDLLSRIELPYMSGYKNALINDEPRHPNGDEMLGEYQLSNGDSLHTHLSGEQKKQYLSELADECEVGINFSGRW